MKDYHSKLRYTRPVISDCLFHYFEIRHQISIENVSENEGEHWQFKLGVSGKMSFQYSEGATVHLMDGRGPSELEPIVSCLTTSPHVEHVNSDLKTGPSSGVITGAQYLLAEWWTTKSWSDHMRWLKSRQNNRYINSPFFTCSGTMTESGKASDSRSWVIDKTTLCFNLWSLLFSSAQR